MDKLPIVEAGTTQVAGNNPVAAALLRGEKADPVYTDGIFRNRIEKTRKGSFYPNATVHDLRARLMGAKWEPYKHPSFREGSHGFITRDMGNGCLGVVDINWLPQDTVLTLLDPKGGKAHWDGRQKVDACWSTPEGFEWPVQSHTIAITGPDESSPSGDVLFTFYPGDPTPPSDVDRMIGDLDRHNTKVTVEEAKKLGFTHVNLV